jgi:tetratricopeptide (TPR) repeat protein
MDPNFQRGLLLLEQSRYSQAETEFRQSILADSENAGARAMLALTLAEQQRLPEAEEEAGEALRLEPGSPFVHYVRARICHSRNKIADAQAAITEAIQLDPEDPDYRALQAQLFLDRRNWEAALESAEQGLALNGEHLDCTNLRAVALVKLGRRQEAGATIEAALARNPENSVTHANQGWALLHAGQHERALEHFREALRLDPENEWARDGILEALKARYFIYSLMLKYFLWMSRLSSRAQWGVILGGYFGMRLLSGMSKGNPVLEPVVFPLQLVYIAFVFLTWTAQPLFNLLLRLNPFGRMILDRKEVVASNWVGAFVLLAILCLVLGLTVVPGALLGALVFAFSVLPLSAIFRCPAGWPQFAMAAYTIAITGAGLLGLALATGSSFGVPEADLAGARSALLGIFLIGIIGSGWIANILIMQRVRR